MYKIKKYYFPTSSENFERIFRTDSISPSIFYRKRHFGGKRFESINNWRSENHIILTNEFPSFELSYQKDKKIIIEINETAFDKDYLVNYKNGIYLYPKTIYLTKENFNLYFETKEELNFFHEKTYEKYTKSINRYTNNLHHLPSSANVKEFNIKEKNINQDNPHIHQEILRDRIFNVIKGSLYGLACGFLLDNSKSTPEIKFQNEIQRVIDGFAVLKNGINNSKETKKNKAIVLSSISKLENLYHSLTKKIPIEELISKYLIEELKSPMEEVNVVIKFLKKEKELTKEYIRIISKKSSNVSLQFYSLKRIIEDFSRSKDISLDVHFKNAIDILEGYICDYIKSKSVDINFNKLFNQIQFDQFYLSFKDKLLRLDGKLLDGFNKILKKFTESNHLLTNQEVSNNYLAGVIKAIGPSWEKSPLYANLTKYEPFDIKKNTNNVLSKNFSAFALKPQNFTELDNFLNQNDIEEKWIAFTFFGTFNGYANLSRVFTSILFDNPSHQVLLDEIDNYLISILPEIDTSKHFEQVNIETHSNLNMTQNLFDRGVDKPQKQYKPDDGKPTFKSKITGLFSPKNRHYSEKKLDYDKLTKELELGIDKINSKKIKEHRSQILSLVKYIEPKNISIFKKKVLKQNNGVGKANYSEITKYLKSY